jgi:hypothetical protein
LLRGCVWSGSKKKNEPLFPKHGRYIVNLCARLISCSHDLTIAKEQTCMDLLTKSVDESLRVSTCLVDYKLDPTPWHRMLATQFVTCWNVTWSLNLNWWHPFLFCPFHFFPVSSCNQSLSGLHKFLVHLKLIFVDLIAAIIHCIVLFNNHNFFYIHIVFYS